jgi:DNA polymerase-3 subunit delta'
MAFSDLPQLAAPVSLLQRSLSRGRLGHAYLFSGESLDDLELLSRNLAKTLNCERHTNGFPEVPTPCDACLSCRKIDHDNHADVRWVRPESKTRIISVEQVRNLMQSVNLKPTEARFKVVTLVSADRLNVQAANAFLKTLEEPPASTVFILLSTDKQRMLETILSRCLHLHCGGGTVRIPEALAEWVEQFSEQAADKSSGLFGRYRLLDQLLQQLAAIKKNVEETMSARSPIERYDDADPKLIERWKDELAAAIEAEYRRQRGEMLGVLQLWFRDVWLSVRQSFSPELAAFPKLTASTEAVAARLDAPKATRNLEVLESTQRLLFTNVQEALALEIGLLKLSL